MSTSPNPSCSADFFVLRTVLERWARAYTLSPPFRRVLVNRTLELAVQDPQRLDLNSLEAALCDLMHKIAREELKTAQTTTAQTGNILDTGNHVSFRWDRAASFVADDDYLAARIAAPRF